MPKESRNCINGNHSDCKEARRSGRNKSCRCTCHGNVRRRKGSVNVSTPRRTSTPSWAKGIGF